MEIRPEINIENTNRGERIVREKLINCFSKKPYIALQSVGMSTHKKKPWAEADFVVFTDFGIFCLEVKGGFISFQKGTWTIGYPDDDMAYISSEGPFKQAEGYVHPILKKLKTSDPIRAKKFIVYWGVVFPNDTFKTDSLEWEPEQVCDKNKIDKLDTFLFELGQFARIEMKKKNIQLSNEIITKDDIDWAVSAIRKDIVPKGKNWAQYQQSRGELIELEKRQNSILDKFLYSHKKRMVISGGAGTGKTLLGITAAKEYEMHDKSVLFICFNKLLSQFLKEQFKDYENIEVSAVHQFMMNFLNLSKIPDDFARKKELFFKSVLVERFEEEIIRQSEEIRKFDLLIIDEAQDVLNEQILSCLFEFVSGGFKDGNWILALDKEVQKDVYGSMSQSTYKKIFERSECFEEPLFRNLRNPKKVAQKANDLFPDYSLPIPTREFSSFPKKWSIKQSYNLNDLLAERLSSLISNGARPEQITILTMKSKYNSFLNNKNKIGPHKVFPFSFKLKNSILWANVSAFKGLENDFIILIEPPDMLSERFKVEYYLALTRAKTEIHILYEEGSFIKEV